MCLVCGGGQMGCGKSRHSPVTSLDDVNNGSRQQQSGGERRKSSGGSSKTSPSKSSTQRSNNSDQKPSSGGPVHNGGISGQTYTLEVPSEIPKKPDTSQRTTKDFKQLTSQKTVHITNSQIEFFKMLDEKIEQGQHCDSTQSVNSEVSSPSLDLDFRH